MRIRRLEFVRFGMFSGRILDFGEPVDGGPDFQIVYGPNESGKTTAMEGYLRLLYGFPTREQFDYKHPRKNLHIKGEVELLGEAKAISRLPSRKPNLFDADGVSLPDNLFQSELKGLEEGEYRKLFCLNDQTIEGGGEEIANGQGEIGNLLFGAAAGISDVQEILERVRGKADAFFKARGSKHQLSILKRELEHTNQQIKEKDTTAAQYRSLQEELKEAQNEETAASGERKRLLEEKARLKLSAKVLPMLDQIKQLRSEVADFAHYPDQVSVDQSRIDEINEKRVRILTNLETLEANKGALAHQLQNLDLDPERLGLQEELNTLEERRSRYVTAAQDLPRREDELRNVVSRMMRTAEDIGLDESVEPKSLALSKAKLAELNIICTQLKRTSDDVAREKAEINELTQKIDAAIGRISDLKDRVPEQSNISEYLSLHDMQRHVNAYNLAIEQIKTNAERAELTLGDLSVRSRNFDSVPTTILTAREAREAGSKLAEIKSQAKNQFEKLNVAIKEYEQLNSAISQLTAETGIISDAEAIRLKTLRDERWREHKSRLTVATAETFESAMRDLDDAADKRLRQASKLGELRTMERQATALKSHQNTIQQQFERLQKKADEQQWKIDNVSKSVGIEPPLSPDGLVDWLQKVDAARTAERELTAIKNRHAETTATADRIRDELAVILRLKGKTLSFTDIVAQAQRLVEEFSKHKQALTRAEDSLKGNRQAKQQRENKVHTLVESKQKESKKLHNFIITEFETEINSTDSDVMLAALNEIRNEDDKRRDFEHRINSMRNDQVRFRQELIKLANRFNIELVQDPSALFSKLQDIGETAQQNADRSKDLIEEKNTIQSKLDSEQLQLREINNQVSEFARQWPESLKINSLADLRVVIAKTHEINTKRDESRKLERQVRSLLGVDCIVAAQKKLDGLSLVEIESKLEEIKKDVDHAEARSKSAIEKRSGAEAILGGVKGTDEVAVLTAKRNTIELEMRDKALEYLELNFGQRLAEEAIRRFSERHRSKMLKATEMAFTELTEGAYKKLQTQHENKKEILMAIDKNESSKRTQSMSKGTRFQLYLALRAAAYEQMATESNTILPFFCDDVFETFDEDRTRAACRLMTRIGRIGQAIYLTHHRHVVDIATKVCGSSLRVLEL